MTFQIKAITIYGKRPGQMRTVPFKTGALNIVTGDSRRGKSALLTIIDYCLASTDYPVKAGKVRDYVSTYAVTLTKPGQQLFVARRAPEAKAAVSTVLCVITQAPDTPPPQLEELHFTTPQDTAKDLLSNFCGIDSTVRVPAVGKNTLIAPSIRHALFFCFQAQNEVANPDVLFHSQGEDWKPNTIRGVIPYFLGAVDREQALLHNRLRNLRRDLADNEAMLAASTDVTPASGQAQALLAEAVEVGLVPPRTGEQPADEVLRHLRNAMVHGAPQAGSPGDDPIAALHTQRTELRRLFSQTRAKIADLKTELAENDEFNDQALEQRARLASLGLLSRDPDTADRARCPVCDSSVPAANETVAGLVRDLAHLDGDLQAIGSDTPAIRRLIAAGEDRLQTLRSELARNQEEINELTTALRTLHREPDDLRRAAIVQGRISLFLDTAAQQVAAPRVHDRREALREQIAGLEEQLSGSTQEERLTSFLSLINQEIKKKAKALDLDFSGSPIRLDIGRLTVVADTVDGPVQLKNMGSAENHLGYHVSTLLSLHEWFAEHHGPVPRVLILDQPSQVYFPAEATGEVELQTNDRMHLLNLFVALHHTLQQLDGKMQIIVMEHADLADPGFSQHVVERWRYGNDSALVPSAWMDHEDS
ncbi:DUF3732 domain-containing protein [Streptomyces sp. NPDC058671]|uniref:DUF3732 domain-containing protein n=1 Tax=Streptomyces sp. NPDC058671 TaxID=3346590 RepID=UPI003645FC90